MNFNKNIDFSLHARLTTINIYDKVCETHAEVDLHLS